MKLSTEAIVAAAIAVVFGALTLGAIAREQGQRGTGSADILRMNQVAALRFDTPSVGPVGGTGESQLLAQY